MFYIHHTTLYLLAADISLPLDLELLHESVNNQLRAYGAGPGYEGIPLGMLRRHGKAVLFGSARYCHWYKKLKTLNGIIIGTANGGMEDCIKFLNQIIDYEEGCWCRAILYW